MSLSQGLRTWPLASQEGLQIPQVKSQAGVWPQPLAEEPGVWQLSLWLSREGTQGQLGTNRMSPNLILEPELSFSLMHQEKKSRHSYT